MLKAINTTETTIKANEVLPITLKRNTFPYVTLNNNTITITKPGKYNISAIVNATATDTTTNIGLYNNGTLIPETNITITSVADNLYELVINDIEIIVATLPVTSSVNLTIQSTTGLTSNVANVSVVELR